MRGLDWGRYRPYLLVEQRIFEIDELLARARTVAGTEAIKATVETALKSRVDQDTALGHVVRLCEPGALDIDRINQARRPPNRGLL